MTIPERKGPSFSNYYQPIVEYTVDRMSKKDFGRGTRLTHWPMINALSWIAFLSYPLSPVLYFVLNSLTIIITLAEIFKTYRDEDLPIYYFATLLFLACRRIEKSKFLFHLLLRASISEFLLFPDIHFIWGYCSVMPIVLVHLIVLV
jgi:hypothetical protein